MQDLTQEAVIIKDVYLINPVLAIDDIKSILAKNKVGITLQMGELLKVARVIKAGAYAKDKILSTGDEISHLKNEVATLFVPQKSPDTPGSPEGNTEGPGTASSEPLLPS